MKIIEPKPGVSIYLQRNTYPKRQDWVPKLEAVEPVYLKDIGSASRVCLSGGEEFYLGQTTALVYRAVAAFHTIDVLGVRRHYLQITRRSQWAPLVIGPRQTVLFAYKSREPQSRNDGATGYIMENCIRTVQPLTEPTGPPGLRIVTASGHELTALMTEASFQGRRMLAKYFQFAIQNIQGYVAD
jgi:hypothetical protein